MGLEIAVTVRAGASPSIRMFELNRSLTGMAIERYDSVEAAKARGLRPPDVLAARLLEAGATHVTVYSSMVTVEAPAERWAELEPKAVFIVEHLFEFYGDDAGWSFEARGLPTPPPLDVAG